MASSTELDNIEHDVALGAKKVTLVGSGSSGSQVQGTAADGAAAVGNPVQVAGKDGSGNIQTILTATDGSPLVQGIVASGATDSGNPQKMGGKYNSTLPTFTDGQRGDIQIGTRGSQNVTIMAQDLASPVNTMATNADAVAASATATRLQIVSLGSMYNGTSFDRSRNNNEATVLSSAVRAVTTNGADQTNYNNRGVMLTINVTVEAATETLSLKLQGKDPVTGNYFDIVDFGVVYNATTDAPTITRSFVMLPGVTAADFIGITGNGTIGKTGFLPRTWRPVVTHSASGNWTYSLGAAVIV